MNLTLHNTILALTAILTLAVACVPTQKREATDLSNEEAYQWRYRNLDSTYRKAQYAYRQSDNYPDGQAEALNTLAFVDIAKMQYNNAKERLKEVYEKTDNQVELLIADIQNMRICQRQSQNKDFYFFLQKASNRLTLINNEIADLNIHQKKRFTYAKSEYGIVASAYFYYIGLDSLSQKMMVEIGPSAKLGKDTAQLLNYYYNIGSGGIIHDNNAETVLHKEFEYLIHCYFLSKQYKYPYWEANSLQSISEHLQKTENRARLQQDFHQELIYLNSDNMPDSLLAGNLAQRALTMFSQYGDIYQIAGAYRTLAECYWNIGDYPSALICLNDALSSDSIVERAPDLVASIREQMSLNYSAIGDKQNSDYNRNIFLDIQEVTRQDRELEARAEQLDHSSKILNLMLVSVVATIILVIVLLFVFDRKRKRNNNKLSSGSLLAPLKQWEKSCREKEDEYLARYEEMQEQISIARQKVVDAKKRNIEQQAKVSLAVNIIPLINRMRHDVNILLTKSENEETRRERYQYITEISDKIGTYNGILTRWIQLNPGTLSLHIESFKLQDVFDMVKRGTSNYTLKNIDFQINSTQTTVKADKTLTLFMINTMAENARKFTPEGGKIVIGAKEENDYVEISIEDTGIGISAADLKNLFKHNIQLTSDVAETNSTSVSRQQHGFGLVNCKGIIEKYKKISSIFNVCAISAESTLGKGSRFWFRLPKGIVRSIVALLCMISTTTSVRANANTSSTPYLKAASMFADSAYYSNIAGTYAQTIAYTDSCLRYLNLHYSQLRPNGRLYMVREGRNSAAPAETEWFRDSLNTDYAVILDIRNETAVAALALHQWTLYAYNNKVYSQLFKECSTDNNLSKYVKVMQRSENNKNIAIIILAILLASIFPAYYFLYYRYRIAYRQCIDNFMKINNVVATCISPQEKLKKIKQIWKSYDDLKSTSSDIEEINNAVIEIQNAIENNIAHNEQTFAEIEYGKDNRDRIMMEYGKLHISNSILDNCLSTIKHETMYYPSRIKQLIETRNEDVKSIHEVLNYYHELYVVLCTQATRQIDQEGQLDKDQFRYLFEIIFHIGGADKKQIIEKDAADNYIELEIPMPKLSLSSEQVSTLFTPETIDMRFFICRQIMRNIGEKTGARACGIKAAYNKAKENIVIITISLAIWKKLKLSL